MGVRWIGSKARVVGEIMRIVGPTSVGGAFVDAFAGTGVVAQAAAAHGWRVRVNDHLLCATIATAARLTATSEVPFAALGGYEEALKRLQATPSRQGFIWEEYSPASAAHGPYTRMYLTEGNAAKIDGIRAQIAEWDEAGITSPAETRLLIADLLAAVNSVANIAGTYGCFLSHWSPAAKKALTLRPRELAPESCGLEVFNVDVNDVPVAPEDTAYLDPPYTKRQYAAYYHLQETVAHGDRPSVAGKTGLRPWQSKASVYCYKSKALEALTDVVTNLDAHRILLSYSSEGHVVLADLQGHLSALGTVTVHQLGAIGRYRPNKPAVDGGSDVNEYVVELMKATAPDEMVASV